MGLNQKTCGLSNASSHCSKVAHPCPHATTPAQIKGGRPGHPNLAPAEGLLSPNAQLPCGRQCWASRVLLGGRRRARCTLARLGLRQAAVDRQDGHHARYLDLDGKQAHIPMRQLMRAEGSQRVRGPKSGPSLDQQGCGAAARGMHGACCGMHSMPCGQQTSVNLPKHPD
jgi:hypothetical protein